MVNRTNVDAMKMPCPQCGGTGQGYDDAAVGAALKAMREQIKCSSKVMASELKISPQYLSDLERGNRRWSRELVGAYQDVVSDAGLVLVPQAPEVPANQAIADAALAWERARRRMFEPGMHERNPETLERADAFSERERELRTLLRQALSERVADASDASGANPGPGSERADAFHRKAGRVLAAAKFGPDDSTDVHTNKSE